MGWLFLTARNLMKAELRRRERESAAMRDAATVGHVDDGLSDIELIRALIGRLPAGHREVLQLTYWDRLTAAETGVALGCSERAVWKRISRAKAHRRGRAGSRAAVSARIVRNGRTVRACGLY